MALTLLAGPANAGKVALLLERYLSALADEPFLIVPNRSDVDRVERELLASSGALLGGEIGTFDDLFRRLARDGGEHRPVATDEQRALIVRRALGEARLNGWTRSARFAGFADALSSALGELEAGLVDPGELEGDLAGLYAEYRAELDRLRRSSTSSGRSSRTSAIPTSAASRWTAPSASSRAPADAAFSSESPKSCSR